MNALVLGAGIFGATAALELRRRGHGVTLVDPGPLPHPDAASTDISKAIRMDYGGDAFYVELMERAFEGWDTWNRAWGKPLYHEDGFLILAAETMRAGEFEHDSFSLLRERGHAVKRMGGSAVRERFPAWSGVYPDGYFNPRAGWAESGAVVGQLLAWARAEGVAFVEASVRGFGDHALTLGSGETLRADGVVVAAGAWTSHLLPELSGFMRPIGQPVFHFLPADPAPFQAPRFSVWAADIGNSGWYGFPALPDGRVKVANHGPGRLVDPTGPREVRADDEPRFREFLKRALPALADAPVVGTRLCLYCDTWDGDFLVDRHPERPGMVVATGGSGHAFKFAPVLGGLVADVAEESAPLARFAWREVGVPRSEDARFAGPAEE